MFRYIIQTCLPIKRAMFLFKLLIPLFALGLVPLSYACEQKIRISAAKDWPPYSYINNGGFSGLDIDIIEMILSDINLCWEYVSFPSSSRAFQEFKKTTLTLYLQPVIPRRAGGFPNLASLIEQSSCSCSHTKTLSSQTQWRQIKPKLFLNF